MESERYERVMAAIHCKVPDRVPWALWGHFPATPFLRTERFEERQKAFWHIHKLLSTCFERLFAY
jgi:hypothetical protein